MNSFPGSMLRRVQLTDTALLIAILLAGAILRFWRLPEIPFTHDEFSAILRTQFTSFHDLIEQGVKIDGHPAGIQVFLYYLTGLFGVSGPVLKIPFIVFGLLSVWLVYLIGKNWFNPTVGLVAASFVSFLQFPVMYSQIARPYASGLFFCLLMVWFWTRVIFHPERKFYLNLAGFTLAASLCTYNHHFSMLFAVMVGATGLFYCRKSKLRYYLAAALAVTLLYVPHLPILFYQLGVGGVEGWLAKPRYDFIADYLQYIFQFSVMVYLLVVVLIGLSLFWYREKLNIGRKYIFISITWFIVPYLVGFFYSLLRSSVLQYSVMIFSFPFLLFALFGFFKELPSLQKLVLTGLIAIIVIPSLVVGRQHYRVFYDNVYEKIVGDSKQTIDSPGTGSITVLLDAKKEINPYILSKLKCTDLPFTYYEDLGGDESLAGWLDTCQTDFLAFGCLASTGQESYVRILEKFPFLVRHNTYAGGDFYLFSKVMPSQPLNEYAEVSVNTFEPGLPEWGWVDEKQCTDSLAISGTKSFANNTGLEFGPTYLKSLRDMIQSENDIIDVSVDLRIPRVFPGAWLVVAITSDGRSIKWLSVPVNRFIDPGETGRVYQSLRMNDVELRHHRLMFSAYIWNPMKSGYIMDNFTIKVRQGNPYIYGLHRKISF